jgi:hypothetical protein
LLQHQQNRSQAKSFVMVVPVGFDWRCATRRWARVMPYIFSWPEVIDGIIGGGDLRPWAGSAVVCPSTRCQAKREFVVGENAGR